MNSSQRIKSYMPEYWEQAYQTGDMEWDLGGPTPIFSQWIDSQKDTLTICILGAGNGWDAINIAKKGHSVTAVDFARSAIKNMHNIAEEEKVKLNLVQSDIFDLGTIYDSCFDVVLEYTCYCAIHPSRRIDYVNIVYKILKPHGKLVALFFPIDKILNDDGPPFGVDLDLTLKSFLKYFTLITKKISNLSIDQRNGKEIFVILSKNGD